MIIRIVSGILGILFVWIIIFLPIPENEKPPQMASIFGLLMGLLFIIYAVFAKKLVKLFPSLGEIKKDTQPNKPSRSQVFQLIFGGIMLVSFGSWWIFQSYQTQSWSQVSGNILEAYCEESGDNGGSVRRVKYEYRVATEKYINNRENIVSIVADGCDSGYTKNQSITVFYDPNNPKESVLINEIQPSAIIVFIVGWCLFAFGIFRMKKLLPP